MPPDLIALALAEDIGGGDVTTEFFTDPARRATARIVARQPCVLAGVEVAAEVFRRVDHELRIALHHTGGAALQRGGVAMSVSGKAASLLAAERTALNFLQRLSGVATLTRAYVSAITGTPAKILDTRKTTPGWRLLEKAAVAAGGGVNHRIGLYDMVMVKDNHLAAGTSLPGLQEAIHRARAARPEIRIELEADTLDQVRDFLTLDGVDVILLDNMPPAVLRQAVALRKPGMVFEASGGVTLETIREIAETGVDFISVGALTHSAAAVDFSMELSEASQAAALQDADLW